MARDLNSARQELRKYLSQFISESAPGRKLPSENALCSKFNLSRMTVGKILNQLREKGEIVRRQGSGSFVAAEKSVIFLLPCPDFLSNINVMACGTPLRMKGVYQACKEMNLKFETVIVSLTNSRDDIDWNAMSRINRESLIYAYGVWYTTLFQFFSRKGAKVCVEHSHTYPYGLKQFGKNFILFNRDRKLAIIRAMEHLWNQGCRRIAIAATPFYSEKFHIYRLEYRKFIELHSMPSIVYEFSSPDKFTPGMLSEFYHKKPFDGLIVGSPIFGVYGSIQQYLGIPEKVNVFGIDILPELSPHLHPFPCFVPPCERMGYEGIVHLLDENNFGREFNYEQTLWHSQPNGAISSGNCLPSSVQARQ